MERVKRIELLHPAWKASVLPLNYTRVLSKLTTLFIVKQFQVWWRGKDSNFRSPKATGLQPAPFDRFGTPPLIWGYPTNLKSFNNKRFISICIINAINHFTLKYAKKLGYKPYKS